MGPRSLKFVHCGRCLECHKSIALWLSFLILLKHPVTFPNFLKYLFIAVRLISGDRCVVPVDAYVGGLRSVVWRCSSSTIRGFWTKTQGRRELVSRFSTSSHSPVVGVLCYHPASVWNSYPMLADPYLSLLALSWLPTKNGLSCAWPWGVILSIPDEMIYFRQSFVLWNMVNRRFFISLHKVHVWFRKAPPKW